MTEDAASPAPVTLCRVLGRWDFTAIGVNQVIGGLSALVVGAILFLMSNRSSGVVTEVEQ